MLCRVTTGLKEDIETCLNDFPDRINLKPSKSVSAMDDEYASVFAIPLILMHNKHLVWKWAIVDF